ncbi:hypothetical protein CLV49_2435 [Labedella gwakjiensis]|uniref:Large extracellular alpha-helical protein n=1 Tax=Labedella gwakjiensis TaxID=390269 RepID=A0A2P8GXV4_9MICO|nr:DUF5719 family protein [Labedella gwakjiensis]PSL38806.1 hypothetical protein CLV49_2435 [Labedella gwakjiensis]RUQ86723.1 hypothetical protein ELQ93_07060 [Labedella gwakjiensis]
MSSTRLTVTRAVRTTVGLVGVAAAVATIVFAGRLDLPDIGGAPASVTVEPVAADQSRVCTGSLIELGQDAAAATAATSVGSPVVVAGDGVDGAATSSTLAAPDDSAGREGPTVLSAEPSDGDSVLAGAQSQSVELERLSGFSASSCTETAAESWLVGGSTDVGQTTVLTLANPSTVDASVSLEVFGESGAVDASGASGIVVAAGSQRIISLAGIAPNLLIPVVHVTSVGAPVAAALQQSAVRSITPEGVDVVGPSASPADSQIIPGFIVPSSRPVDRADGYDFRVPGVRVLAPGGFDAQVTVVARASDGTLSEPRTVTTAAGTVTDVPLDDLAPGEYTLLVTSDQPVTSAGHSASSRDDKDDFAWFAATTPLAATATVAVPPGAQATMRIANPTDEDRTVSLVSSGAETTVDVPAGGSIQRDVDGDVVYELSGTDGLHAAVTLLGDVGISSYPLTAPSAASDPVVVRMR